MPNQRTKRVLAAPYIRNVIFGVEDSLVSTVGLVSGIAAAGVPESHILVTGVVLVFVEAFSMAVGSFLSEQSAEEYIEHRRRSSARLPVALAIVMFFSYFIAGFIPLVPYVLLNRAVAFPTSIVASVTGLFILGLVSGRVIHRPLVSSALRMAVVGGMAVLMGILVGVFFPIP